MAGGLLQIVSYGSQDIFLTGTPQITFFKAVHRRHTNFSIESVYVPFDDPVGFNSKSTLTIPKIGDLIHKAYLEIILPEINLNRLDATNDPTAFFEARDIYSQVVTPFMGINRQAYISAYDIVSAQNTLDYSKIITNVNGIFSGTTNQNIIAAFQIILENAPDAPFGYNEISMQSIVNNFPPSGTDPLIDKYTVFNAMTVGIDKSIKTQNYFFTILKNAEAEYLDNKDTNIKFAWVNKVGHAILDVLELHIGGQKIDRQFGDWLNIWHELSGDIDTDVSYDKLIGDVPILTTFDREIKPSYKLKVPLQFWFNKFSGLAIPLVALEYHDVRLEIKFRKIEDVSYVEAGKEIQYKNTEDGIYLEDVPEQLGINISAQLLIDYIYLDSSERKRFAQASHEYLIEQLQVLELPNTSIQKLQINLNNFVHPSKELIWVAQKASYTENLTGWTKNRWENYSLTDVGEGNPIAFSSLDFNSYNRVLRMDGNYFNYVQPYQSHLSTPSDGINMYTFSLFPEEFQPSGSANLSRISRIVLNLELDNSLFVSPIPIYMNIRIYTRNTNILRIASGMAGLAFTYG
jgi:hypothetical protein